MTKQERATRTRDALIRSAAREFDQHGYAPARLSVISTGAGVSPGALHFHFENKAAVAAAVEAEAAAALRRTARTVHREASNALQSLADTTHALAGLLREDVVVRAGFRLSCSNVRRTDLNLRQEWQSCVQQRLAEAADEGVLAMRRRPCGRTWRARSWPPPSAWRPSAATTANGCRPARSPACGGPCCRC